MRSTDRVAAHLPEYLKLTFGSADVECSTQSAQIMVLIDAFDLDMFTIDVDTRIWIKT